MDLKYVGAYLKRGGSFVSLQEDKYARGDREKVIELDSNGVAGQKARVSLQILRNMRK